MKERPLFSSKNRDAAALARTLARLAVTDMPILVEGETGTGKTAVAVALHRRSRPQNNLVVADCGSWPGTLAPAELFGHTAGAFTDATRSRTGWLERAGDGTLVLDRLDVLAPEAQVALLRAVEERRFSPVGGRTSRSLRARIVALADAGLKDRVTQGVVRQDLYFRLAGFHAVLPPLRCRSEDIVPAARAELRRQRRRLGRLFSLTPEAEELLVACPWPGNFRQLQTVLAAACLRGESDSLGPGDLALEDVSSSSLLETAAARGNTLAQVQRLYALLVLSNHGGNVTRTAKILGVSRRTLIRWRRE